MKKKMRVISLVLVMAIALIGAGYAAWGNSIVDNTTLNTGHWEVVLENDVLGHSLIASDEVNYFTKNGSTYTQVGAAADIANTSNYSTIYDVEDSSKLALARKAGGSNYVYTIAPTITDGKKTATFNFYNMHPGTKADTSFEIRNMGSIPAKIADISVLCTGTRGDQVNIDKLYSAIKVSGSFYKHHNGDSGTTTESYTIGTLPSGTTLANLEDKLEDILVKDNVMLLPKEAISPTNYDSDELEVNNLKFEIPMDSLNGYEGIDAGVKAQITFDFVQYNQIVAPTVEP